MSRKYERVKILETQIFQMREEGKSNREIREHFELTKKQLENLINRYNRQQKSIKLGAPPRLKGRPRKYPAITDSAQNKTDTV